MTEPAAGRALADRGAAFVRRRNPAGLRGPLAGRGGS
jgi:hypothetical protein